VFNDRQISPHIFPFRRNFMAQPGSVPVEDRRVVEDRRLKEAQEIVRRRMWWAAGGGVVPIPILDFAAVAGVQLWMLRDLCRLYNVGFERDRGKRWIASLVGGFTPSVLKAIPAVGFTVGVLTGPAFAAASTYAVGKVFIQHFESGGTLLTFDPQQMKSHFEAYFKEGEGRARDTGTTAGTRSPSGTSPITGTTP
jgi:uncharacterized protein (DUF697 family)